MGIRHTIETDIGPDGLLNELLPDVQPLLGAEKIGDRQVAGELGHKFMGNRPVNRLI